MRRLPRKINEKQRLIIMAVDDYFGETPISERPLRIKLATWIMGRRKGTSLTEEEKRFIDHIKNNLADEVYCSSFKTLLGGSGGQLDGEKTMNAP